MIDTLKISDSINLKEITLNDADSLFKLMYSIYIPPYKHLWRDGGDWYVQNTFNTNVLKQELADNNASYYFVEFKNEKIGILRIIQNVSFVDLKNKKGSKLHRIYLNPKVHGNGIGKLLMEWTAQKAIENNSDILWLEVMDTQEQALKFYTKLGYKIAGDFKLEFELMHKHLRGMHRMYLVL